jgi:uncharacterized membrane protein HdeD (DUF308 family)
MTPAQRDEVRAISDGWWLLLLWGVLTILVGLFLVTSPALTAIALFTLLGAYFVVGGIVDIVSAIAQRGAGWGWRLALGILYVVAGVAVLGSPIWSTIFGLAILFYFLAFSAIIGGIVEIVRAVVKIGKLGFGAVLGGLLLGILQLVIGLFLLENPIAGTLTLVPVMGFFAIAAGVVAIIGAFRVKNLAATV